MKHFHNRINEYYDPSYRELEKGKVTPWEEYDKVVSPSGKMIDMRKLVDEQQMVKVTLGNHIPWFKQFLSSFRFIYTFRVDTQSTDGRDIFVNPEFTSELDFEGKVFVMAHEILHCVLNHFRRAAAMGVTPAEANIAADYEVNSTLVHATLANGRNLFSAAPKWCYYDEKYTGWSFERIFKEIGASKNQQPRSGGGSGSQSQSGGGGSQQQSSGSGSQSQSGGSGSQQQSNGGSQPQSGSNGSQSQSGGSGSQSQSGGGGSQSGNGGSQSQSNGSGSQSGNGILNSPRDLAGSGDKNIGDARGESVDKAVLSKTSTPGGMIDEKTADEICKSEGYDPNSQSQEDAQRDAMNKAKATIGNAPGSIKSALGNIFYTNTDWKKLLKTVIGKSLSSNEDMRYLNKNTYASRSGLARSPKDKYDNVDFICCCIDTSGSVTQKMMEQMLSEVYTMALQKKPVSLAIVQADTKIQDVQIFSNLREFKKKIPQIKIKGGGGTSFLNDLWQLIERDRVLSRKKCELLMIFTDGYIANPEQRPRSKKMDNLCWVIVDNTGWEAKYPDRHTYKINVSAEQFK